jgi:hypothetical protein
MATPFICRTCGTQFAPGDEPPAACPICQDERQYVGYTGQQWTTLDELRRQHTSQIQELEPGLTGIGITPAFAINQRALLVQTPEGNLLWDCIALLDEATIAAVRALGGVRAIAISHPHYYTTMVEWAQTFGATVFLHADDRAHVLRPDPAIRFWEGETLPLFGGLTLIRCGGHFAGAQVLHWPAGAAGRGALLTGDIIMVAQDRRYVSFMYSYPNLIPLSARAVRRIVAAVEPFACDRIYGAWWERVVHSDARAAVARSAARYIAAIEG